MISPVLPKKNQAQAPSSRAAHPQRPPLHPGATAEYLPVGSTLLGYSTALSRVFFQFTYIARPWLLCKKPTDSRAVPTAVFARMHTSVPKKLQSQWDIFPALIQSRASSIVTPLIR